MGDNRKRLSLKNNTGAPSDRIGHAPQGGGWGMGPQSPMVTVCAPSTLPLQR